MAKKPLDAKAKAKRQKIIAAVGGVLLLGILVIQVPRTMKMLHPKAPPPPPAAAPASPATPTAGTAVPVASRSDGKLPDSEPAPSAGTSGLISFGRFASKDPFEQQINADNVSLTPVDTSPKAGGNGPQLPSGKAPPSGPTESASLPTSADISVNGVRETVGVGKDFPAADPIFHVVVLTANAARISIVGGTYANGAPTVTLVKGKPLTLMNTSDGSRYRLELIELH
jgi:hypothetical protein